MKSVSYHYEKKSGLEEFVRTHGITDSSALLIQVFTYENERKFIHRLLDELGGFFQKAKIVGTTTDGQILEGKVVLTGAVITFSEFEKTSLKLSWHEHEDEGYASGRELAKRLVGKNTQALITFATCYNTSGEKYLEGINSVDEKITIAGGIAAHREKSKRTYVFTNDKILKKGAVAVALDSEHLHVYADYSYNWSKIGLELTVTKAKGNRVYTIGNRSAYDTYRHYLGEDIAKALPASGTEFPLIIKRDGFLVSRAVSDVHPDGSLSFAGAFSESDVVQFGYGDIKSIYEKSTQIATNVSRRPAQAIFIYSCLARRHYLNDDIENELYPLKNIAPSSGFFTHGEFFSARKKEFLNQTMTLLVLSESKKVHTPKQIRKLAKEFSHQAISINALAHLINVVSEEVKQSRKILQEQKNAFETLFEKSAEGILLLDGEKIVDCNEAAYKALRYSSKKELIGLTPQEISPKYQPDGRLSDEAAKHYIETVRSGKEIQFEWLHRGGDNIQTWFEIKLAPIAIEDKQYIYASLRNIQNRKEMEAKLYRQANYDGLTGLTNRTLFYDRLQHAIAHAKREKVKFALFFIDLDMFKEINDSYGHEMGDKLLMEVANRLRRNIRADDTVARIGGDEFTIIMEKIKHLDEVARKARKILKDISKPYTIDDHTFYISCSIGISIYPDDTQELHDLVKFADTAMYKAKHDGRNRMWFYSNEMTQIVSRKIAIENGIHKALKNGEFQTYYQPIVEGESNKIVGAEALIRWHDKQKGVIFPDEFIPIAEQSDLIIEIDNQMMQNAVSQFAKWRKEGKDPGVLSLNLAVKQLENPDFFDRLQRTLEKYDFDPKWLKLEILERQVMQRAQENVKLFLKLHKLGIALAVDDFGTGESSFLYLKKFPITQIKIDKSFVLDMNEKTENKEIVKAIIALGNALGLEVLAEGVENGEIKEYLLKNGCNLMQGYHFSKPIDAKEFAKLLCR